MRTPRLLTGFLGGWLLFQMLAGHALAADDCEPRVGNVVSAEGRVEIQRVGDTRWIDAVVDEILCEGDTVRAASHSRAALALINDAVLRVDQNSAIRLVNITNEPEERSLLSLLFGGFQSFSREPRELEVDTPYLNGAIEGTEFVFRVEDNRSLLTVFEGEVRAFNAQGELAVAAGQSVVAEDGQAPQYRTVVRPRDAAQWALYYPPVLALGEDSGLSLASLEAVPVENRDAGYFLQRAALLLSVGRVDEARPAIQQALSQAPGNASALALRAIIAVVGNNHQQALDDAQQAVSLAPDAVAPRIALSYALQSRFRIPEARQTLLEAVEAQPTSAMAWARLSETHLMLGDREQALSAAQRATELDPSLARARIVLGFAALAAFDTSTARDNFNQALALDDADPLVHLGLGLTRINDGELVAGRRDIEIAVGLDSENALLRSYLGKAYFEERRPPLDSEQFAIATELDELDPTAYFYNAITLQSANQPVQALESLEAAIERNDNRAVYRGRLLLDQDRAARGTSLGRIFNDLGFTQLGVNAATQSLGLDPGNASAHRFLADSYRDVDNREIARVSEGLQAQMLQDISINPVQPSLAETGLNIASHGGPATPGFNEFTPLFQGNGVRADLSAFGGTQETYGAEAVVSGLYEGFSLSAGGFYYDTDGFRDNNYQRYEIYNLFGQAALSPTLNVQAELRRRESTSGDISLNFDPDVFFDDLRREFDEDSARVGLRFSPDPASDLLLSFIYSDRKEIGSVTQGLVFPDGTPANLSTDTNTESESYQAEGQYLWRGENVNLTAGVAYARVDQDILLEQSLDLIGPLPSFMDEPQIDDYRGYVYGNVNIPSGVTWTIGLSAQRYEEDAFEVKRLNPKVGISWDVTEALRFRAAFFQVVKPALASNRTLEPTQVAGFNQLFDDANATKSTRYGAAVDWRINQQLFLGAEFTRRELEQPVFVGDQADYEDRDEWLHRAYLYWTPNDWLSVSAEAVYDRFESPDDAINPDLPRKLKTLSFPLRARVFLPSGWFGDVGVTYVDQQLERSELSLLADGDSSFALVDLALGYRFMNRRGVASLSVQNLFDKDFEYQNNSFREFRDEPSTGPYIPERIIMGRITLNF